MQPADVDAAFRRLCTQGIARRADTPDMVADEFDDRRPGQSWPSLHGFRRRGLLVAALVAICAGVIVQVSGAFPALEGASIDARYRMRPAEPPSDVVVVDIDAATFDELGWQWPFPRSEYGRLARRLHAAGAREIVLDIQFTEATTPREDLALYDSLKPAGGAVLATTESDERGGTDVLGGDENLRLVDSVAAAADLPYAEGVTIRRVPHSVGHLATIAVAVARRQKKSPTVGDFEPGGAWIDFAGPAGSVPTVSFADAWKGRVDPGAFRGKIVVVGTSSPSLHDVHLTPFGDAPMSGPELQANAISTVLAGMPLRTAPPGVPILAIVILAGAVPLLAARLPLGATLVVAPVLGGAYVGLAQLLFSAGTAVPVVPPLAALLVTTVGTVIAGYLLVARERRRIATYNVVLEHKVRERTAELQASQLEVVQRLGRAVDFRDQETGDHIRRMSELSRRLGLATGMSPDEARTLQHAAALHDVGKIGIPDHVLLKRGKLDADEMETVQRHTIIGSGLLAGSRSALVQMAELIALTHHERWDGTGYPDGLAGEAIPLVGRICSICDVFDALTSDRPYKVAWPVEDALSELLRQSGKQFDPRLVELFLELDLSGVYPAHGHATAQPVPSG